MFVAGRDNNSDLVFADWMLPEDSGFNCDQTSSKHFVLYRKRGQTYIKDKSRNGTFVNGEKMDSEEKRGLRLRNGSRIAILSTNVELFWYLDEDEIRIDARFTKQINDSYLVASVVGEGTFGKYKFPFVL